MKLAPQIFELLADDALGERDFGTLYSLSLSSKFLQSIAEKRLYRTVCLERTLGVNRCPFRGGQPDLLLGEDIFCDCVHIFFWTSPMEFIPRRIVESGIVIRNLIITLNEDEVSPNYRKYRIRQEVCFLLDQMQNLRILSIGDYMSEHSWLGSFLRGPYEMFDNLEYPHSGPILDESFARLVKSTSSLRRLVFWRVSSTLDTRGAKCTLKTVIFLETTELRIPESSVPGLLPIFENAENLMVHHEIWDEDGAFQVIVKFVDMFPNLLNFCSFLGMEMDFNMTRIFTGVPKIRYLGPIFAVDVDEMFEYANLTKHTPDLLSIQFCTDDAWYTFADVVQELNEVMPNLLWQIKATCPHFKEILIASPHHNRCLRWYWAYDGDSDARAGGNAPNVRDRARGS